MRKDILHFHRNRNHSLVDLILRLRSSTRIQQFCRFCLVGGIGVITDSTLLFILVKQNHVSTIAAKVIASEVAMLGNFSLNELWTFAAYRQGGLRGTMRRLLGFQLLCSVGMFISTIALAVFINMADAPLLPANLAAIFIATIWNFASSACLNWKANDKLP